MVVSAQATHRVQLENVGSVLGSTGKLGVAILQVLRGIMLLPEEEHAQGFANVKVWTLSCVTEHDRPGPLGAILCKG